MISPITPYLLNRFRRALLRALPHLHEGLREEAAAFLVTGQLDLTTMKSWLDGQHTEPLDSHAAYLLRFSRILRTRPHCPKQQDHNFKYWLGQFEVLIPSTDEKS